MGKGATISTQISHTRLNLKSMNKKEDYHAELGRGQRVRDVKPSTLQTNPILVHELIRHN